MRSEPAKSLLLTAYIENSIKEEILCPSFLALHFLLWDPWISAATFPSLTAETACNKCMLCSRCEHWPASLVGLVTTQPRFSYNWCEDKIQKTANPGHRYCFRGKTTTQNLTNHGHLRTAARTFKKHTLSFCSGIDQKLWENKSGASYNYLYTTGEYWTKNESTCRNERQEKTGREKDVVLQ